MPDLTEEYLKNLLPRLEVLMQTGNVIIIKTDNGSHLLAELHRFPDRRETDPNNEYEIYPFAKLLTEDELKEFKMEGQTPEIKNT